MFVVPSLVPEMFTVAEPDTFNEDNVPFSFIDTSFAVSVTFTVALAFSSIITNAFSAETIIMFSVVFSVYVQLQCRIQYMLQIWMSLQN